MYLIGHFRCLNIIKKWGYFWVNRDLDGRDHFKSPKVHPNGAVDVWSESTGAFTVNEQQLKPYFVG